uniref:hypothetical protein n=1 Tax=Marinobacterium profundum TaxID=1714300 RepID=UPI000830223F|nr:hypothetical protein [Marinobacterium profundum]
MKGFGIAFLILGGLAGVVALNMDVTVSSGVYDRTYNMHKASQQLMVMLLALGSFISGAVLLGCGEIAERLSNSENATIISYGASNSSGQITGENPPLDSSESGLAGVESKSDDAYTPLSEAQAQFNPRIAIGLSITIVICGLLFFFVVTS